MSKDLFPLSVAKGVAFCNRTEEQHALIQNVENGAHTVLVGPRRYGKTSLSRQVASNWAIDRNKKVAVSTSMLSVSNATDVAQKIVDAVSKAVAKILPPLNTEELKKLAASVNSVALDVSFGADGLKFSLSAGRNTADLTVTITSIGKILTKLDEIAGQRNWKVMLEIDEFQEVSRLKESYAIEAEIREAIQHAGNISCVFLGSNRQMLEVMFTEKSRPFYKMCHIMKIQRIEAVHYQIHLENMSKAQWTSAVPSPVVYMIIELTERHPYYVNKLCYALWQLDSTPTKEDVLTTWDNIIIEEEPNIVTVLTGLSNTQKGVINQLAIEPISALGGKKFLTLVNLASSTVRTAIAQLKKDDVVYKHSDGMWHVMDPCLSAYLRK